MKRIVLYPTHRKFIRLLRSKTKYGEYVVLRKEDLFELKKILSNGNLNSVDRHQKLYKCILGVVNNNSYNEECILLDINKIRDYICQRERKTLQITIRNTFIYYLIKYLSKLIRKS